MSARNTLRFLAGIGSFFALIVVVVVAVGDVNNAIEADASAVQVIQLYTEYVFYAVIGIGVAIAMYVFSRALD